MPKKGNQRHAPYHVCSLSLSELHKVEQELKYHESTIESQANGQADEYALRKQNQLRWITLAMQYNRHTRLQYVHANNLDKSMNPKFRLIKMRPFFNFWYEENVRGRWNDLREAIDDMAAQQRVLYKARQFQQQRTNLSTKALVKSYNMDEVLLSGLVDYTDSLEALESFQTMSSTNMKMQNRDRDYCLSDALEEWSDTGDLNEEELAELKKEEFDNGEEEDEDRTAQEEFIKMEKERGDFEPILEEVEKVEEEEKKERKLINDETDDVLEEMTLETKTEEVNNEKEEEVNNEKEEEEINNEKEEEETKEKEEGSNDEQILEGEVQVMAIEEEETKNEEEPEKIIQNEEEPIKEKENNVECSVKESVPEKKNNGMSSIVVCAIITIVVLVLLNILKLKRKKSGELDVDMNRLRDLI